MASGIVSSITSGIKPQEDDMFALDLTPEQRSVLAVALLALAGLGATWMISPDVATAMADWLWQQVLAPVLETLRAGWDLVKHATTSW